jgi:hypothetical protein
MCLSCNRQAGRLALVRDVMSMSVSMSMLYSRSDSEYGGHVSNT